MQIFLLVLKIGAQFALIFGVKRNWVITKKQVLQMPYAMKDFSRPFLIFSKFLTIIF